MYRINFGIGDSIKEILEVHIRAISNGIKISKV